MHLLLYASHCAKQWKWKPIKEFIAQCGKCTNRQYCERAGIGYDDINKSKIIKIENYREWAKKKYVETKGTLEKEPFD